MIHRTSSNLFHESVHFNVASLIRRVSSCTKVLWRASESRRNTIFIDDADVAPLLLELLTFRIAEIDLPTMGVIVNVVHQVNVFPFLLWSW